MVDKKAHKLHCDLMREIAVDYLAEDANKSYYKSFIQNVKKYFTTPRQKRLKEVDDILEELRRLDLLDVGEYDVLLELTNGIDKDLTELIKVYKVKIGGVLDDTSGLVKNRKRNLSEEDSDVGTTRRRMRTDSDNDTGDEFRKCQDTSLKTKDIKQFFDQKFLYSVGSIDLGDGSVGTGFCVGSKYIMSACHIFREKLDKIWNVAVECAQEDNNRQMNWQKLTATPSECTSPEEGIKHWLESWKQQNHTEFNISALLAALGSAGLTESQERLKEYLLREWQQKCLIRFGPDKDKKDNTFSLKMDIPYMDRKYDIIILELAHSLEQILLPKSFRLQREATQLREEMHLFGYPRMHEGHQIMDPRCEVFCSTNKRQKAAASIREAANWFRTKFPKDTMDFDGYYREEVEQHLNDRSSYIIFHSSESTAHGASGSPGIIDLASERPVVQAMLQRGCPSFTYHPRVNGAYHKGTEIPLHYLFEKGITMAKVHTLLENKVDLRNDLFYNVQ